MLFQNILKIYLIRSDVKPGIKVVVDCANGAASYLSPLILRMAGCSVLAINSQPDGFFPGRLPEPSEKNLQELMKVVKATKSRYWNCTRW